MKSMKNCITVYDKYIFNEWTTVCINEWITRASNASFDNSIYQSYIHQRCNNLEKFDHFFQKHQIRGDKFSNFHSTFFHIR